jgi:hypothetical protein
VLRPRAARLLETLVPARSTSARDRRARAGSLVLFALAPHSSVLRPLTSALRSEDPEVVPLASAALGAGASQYPGAAVALAAVLRSHHGVGSLTTAWALGRALGRDPSQPGLLAGDSSPRVRRSAVLAAAAAAAALPAADGIALLSLVQAATRDRDDRVRATACRALGKLPPEAGLALLAGALHDPSAEVAKAAAAGLGDMGTRAAGALLVQRLPTAAVGLAPVILRALEGVKGSLPREALEWLSGRDDRLVAIGLQCAVAMSGAEVASPTVGGLLRHAKPSVRTEAARASFAFLRRLGPGPERAAIVDALLSALQTELDVPTLGAIGDALAAAGDLVAAQSMLARMPGLDRPGRERLLESVALGELLGQREARR